MEVKPKMKWTNRSSSNGELPIHQGYQGNIAGEMRRSFFLFRSCLVRNNLEIVELDRTADRRNYEVTETRTIDRSGPRLFKAKWNGPPRYRCKKGSERSRDPPTLRVE